MGRILKKFTIENVHGKSTDIGKIDSGADVTLVRLDIGRKLGVDPAIAEKLIAIGGIGQQRLIGIEVPAQVRVGRASATLTVVVPIGRYDAKTKKIKAVSQQHNLIGHDFLQATKSKIDFSRPIDDAFVEGDLRVDDVVRLKITKQEKAAFREWARSQTPTAKRRAPRRKRR